jgi:hypothetical protein
LNFRSVTGRQSVTQAYYQARVDGEWRPPRQYANGSARNLTYWQASSVGTEGGFRSVLAGKELGTEQKHDLYRGTRRMPRGLTSGLNPTLCETND